MWWVLFLLPTCVWGNSDIDLSAVQELGRELPNFENVKQSDEDVNITRHRRNFSLPETIRTLSEIKASGKHKIAIPSGTPIRNLSENKNYKLTRLIYAEVYNIEDEFGFKYIANSDGSIKWLVRGRSVESIEPELELYEPPTQYTPAPTNIVRTEYDRKLTIPPEFSFYIGAIQGDYMADLFNDSAARSGVSQQYGLHFFTDWKLPIKAGAVIHLENSNYNLSGGGRINYTSISFGPQFKTREFEIMNHPLRLQMQFRVSPFSRLSAETVNGPASFEFDSADLLSSIERPIKNSLGEFVLGIFIQSQWLNLQNQPDVNISATNKTNKSLGLSLSQVFQ